MLTAFTKYKVLGVLAEEALLQESLQIHGVGEGFLEEVTFALGRQDREVGPFGGWVRQREQTHGSSNGSPKRESVLGRKESRDQVRGEP